jgi:hypothetical protein
MFKCLINWTSRFLVCGLFVSFIVSAKATADEVLSQPFDLEVNMLKSEGHKSSIEPRLGTVQNLQAEATASAALNISARAKALADTVEYLQVDVYIENRRDYPVDAVVLNFDQDGGAGQIWDLTTDAYNKQALAAPYALNVGRIAAYGVKRVILSVKKSLSPHLRGTITLKPSSGEGQMTTDLLVSPANDELWAVSSDTNEVVAYALPGKQEIARLAVGAQPAGLALQKSRDWIVVSSAKGNSLTVIDRRTKTVLSVLGNNEEFGRELRYVLVSQKSPTIYVSSYVEGTLSEIKLNDAAQVASSRTLKIGARPTGMSMTFDESQLYIAHFLPRGDINHNEAWISVVTLPKFVAEKDAVIEDHFNPDNPRMQCLADFYNNYLPAKLIYGKLKPTDFSLEGTASQLSGVFLDPAGQVAWVPGTRITGALVVLERGQNADKSLKRFGGLQPAQLSAPLIFPLDASKKSELNSIYTRDVEMALPSLKNIVYCMRHPLEIEFIDRALQSNGKEQTNPFLAYGVPHAGLTG